MFTPCNLTVTTVIFVEGRQAVIAEKHGEAARNRGFWLCWRSVWGSCYEDSPGCVVVIVGEPVGDAS